MHFLRTTATSAALLASTLAAQSVSVQFEALTPLTLNQMVGSTASVGTVAAGPLGAFGNAASGVDPNTNASLVWWSDDLETSKRINLVHNLVAAAGDIAWAGPHEFLVTITPTTPNVPVLAALSITRISAGSPGAPAAGVSVDILNDGSFETTNLLGLYIPLPANGAPLAVRLVFEGVATSGTTSGTGIYFDVRPTNGLTILDAAVPCAPSYPPFDLIAEPVFTNYGISFATSAINDPALLLIGLSAQAVVLPTPAPVPCVVIPSPDLVLLSPNGSAIGTQIDIPLSVRPATLFAQAVHFAPIGLVTSRAVRVSAQ